MILITMSKDNGRIIFPVVMLKSLAPFKLFIAHVIRKYKKVKMEMKLLVGSGLLVKNPCFVNSKKSLCGFSLLFVALSLLISCSSFVVDAI